MSWHKKRGDERAAKPVELLLDALAGCIAMDVLSILQKKREPIAGLEVGVTGARAEEHPKIYTDIEVIYWVRGQVNPKSMSVLLNYQPRNIALRMRCAPKRRALQRAMRLFNQMEES